MKFDRTQIVYLSNVSIIGNGNSGCSSVLVQKSTIFINNSMFTEISGFLGAAVMMVASNVTFRGNNVFINNTAASGGSIYLSNSMLTFNGTSIFLNSTSLGYSKEVINRTLSLCNIVEKIELKNGNGGAIFCTTSYLRFYEHSNFTGNSAELFGGAIAMAAGTLTIQGNASFGRNIARFGHGGAILLMNTNSNISGNLYLKHNKALHGCGGAIWILKGEFIIQGNTSLDGNFAKTLGGALYISSSKFIFYGNNSATIRRGEVHTNESKANKCSTCTIPLDDSITFLHNTADEFGGSICCLKECDVGLLELMIVLVVL